MTDYSSRAEAQIRQYESPQDIHDLPAIFHLWSNSYLTLRLRSVFGVSGTTEFYVNFLVESFSRTGINRVLSIGAGDASIEIGIANALRARGLTEFHIDCLELSPVLVERAADAIRQNALRQEVLATVCDINLWQPDATYGAVMAHHSLHHIANLEHVFAAIDTALAADGYFVTQDMIGRNGHMRWQETLAVVNHIWKQLPIGFKYNRQLHRLEQEYDNWDCSTEGFEGIRAQDILPLCIEHFEFRRFFGWGGLVEVFLDRGFGPNFDAADPFDQEIVRRTQALEDQLIDGGWTKPTMMAAVIAKRASEPPIVFRTRTPEFCRRPPDRAAPSLPALDWQLPDRSTERRARYFRPLTDGTVIDFGRPTSIAATRMTGWYPPEPEVGGCWSGASSATVLLSLRGRSPGPLALSFEVSPYIAPSEAQQVDVVVNGSAAVEWTFNGGMDAVLTRDIAIPEQDGKGDDLLIEFRIHRPRIAAEDGGPDLRSLGLLLRRLTVTIARHKRLERVADPGRADFTFQRTGSLTDPREL
jgi:SAM-dependent methyltransferase